VERKEREPRDQLIRGPFKGGKNSDKKERSLKENDRCICDRGFGGFKGTTGKTSFDRRAMVKDKGKRGLKCNKEKWSEAANDQKRTAGRREERTKPRFHVVREGRRNQAPDSTTKARQVTPKKGNPSKKK